MNIYAELNKVMQYVEKHLDEKIDPHDIAKMVGMSEYTFQRIFSIICNTSFSEYIRNRRLSNAGQELFMGNEKIIDIATKYQYNNATSFSRAFERFHGIKPSQVKKSPEKLKMYSIICFNENIEYNKNMDYKIVEKDEMTLYGIYKNTDNIKIKKDAPNLYRSNIDKYGLAPYAMIEYKDRERLFVKKYWILYLDQKDNMEKIVIPKSKWIQIRINSQEPEDIQRVSENFYDYFIPSTKYNFRELPELEYYHDDITDFLIPIED